MHRSAPAPCTHCNPLVRCSGSGGEGERERWRAPESELAGLCVRELVCQAGRYSARLTAEPRSS
jgi:hypothetical protein